VGSELGLITYDVPDKALWFYEATSYQFGRLDPATGAITEYPVFSHTDPTLDQVSQIVAGPDGNIYFTEPNLNKIGLLDIKTHLLSQFNMILADTQRQGIVVGGDGQLWFTEGGQNKIGSLNPLSHVVPNYPFEPATHTTNDQAEGITVGPNDALWFVERQNNAIVSFTIASGPFSQPIRPIYPPGPPPTPPPAPPSPPPSRPAPSPSHTDPT